MTNQESNFDNPDTLLDDFIHRHNITATPFVKRELNAIYWTIRSKLEIDNDLNNHAEKLDHLDPLWGLLRSMLDRIFEYVEGAIVAYVTGSTASSEIISRTVVESAVNLLFILVDDRKGNRLTQYFAHYFENEQKEIDNWAKATSQLTGKAQKVHQAATTEKRKQINELQKATDYSLLQIGLPATKDLAVKFPPISKRFELLKLDVAYRTVYAALCSQTHNDAEDLLNYFFATLSDDQQLIEKTAIDTVNFSRLMLYYAVEYFVMVASGFAIRFELTNTFESLRLGQDVISQTLEEIAKELQ
ncbi:MAG: hypothetical protein IH588_18310 [Anaerolineales bacterium]|nr:hypothetical protein [Anaerolineales bacterium]